MYMAYKPYALFAMIVIDIAKLYNQRGIYKQ